MNYTKGKWKVNIDWQGDVRIKTPDDEDIAIILGSDKDYKSNAQLIAAAPDMYEALKGVLQAATPSGVNSRMVFEKEYLGGFVVLGNRLDAAVKALAKAERREEYGSK